MFQSADDVARAALGLADLAGQCAAQGQLENAARVEIAAAALAVHVADWHALPGSLDGNLRDRFTAFSADWSTLKDIVNGVKHPLKQPGPHEQREPEWEDDEFWEAAGLGPTLLVQVDGRWRSVRALTIDFCAHYLADSDKL